MIFDVSKKQLSEIKILSTSKSITTEKPCHWPLQIERPELIFISEDIKKEDLDFIKNTDHTEIIEKEKSYSVTQ